MFNHILCVCVGNICRSPMAEAVLRQRVSSFKSAVSSAGIAALIGQPAHQIAQELMQQRSLDIGSHKARQLNAELVTSADLILVMEQWQQKEVECSFPNSCGKVHRLGKWGNFDIADPYAMNSRAAFEDAYILIERGLDEWQSKFWS